MEYGGREAAGRGSSTLTIGSSVAASGSTTVLDEDSAPPSDDDFPVRDAARAQHSLTTRRGADAHQTAEQTGQGARVRRLAGHRAALAVADGAAAALAGALVLSVASYATRSDAIFATALPVLWVVAIVANGGYERRFVGAGSVEFTRVFRAFLHLTVALVFGLFLAGVQLSREIVVPALGLVLVLTALGRYAARKVLHRQRRAGGSLTPVIAVGGAESVTAFASMLRRDQYAGMTVVGACLVAPVDPGTAAAAQLRVLGIRDLGAVETIADAIRQFDAPTVAVLSGEVGADRLRRIAWHLEGSDADLVVSPGLAELGGRRMHITPVAGLPLLHIDVPRFTGFSRFVKTAFDVTAASLALVLLAPLLLCLGLVVRITSRGPALFRQTRVGRDGREFTMLKFRSMCADAEDRREQLLGEDDGNGVLFKLRSDPRVTPIGRVLRRFSLDELPQLINVVTGSMSLVGPRPPLPEEVVRYHVDAHRRLLVRPGLTGLWQISGRSDLSWDDSIRLDLRYVEDWSLSLDLLVLWKTARAVVRSEGAY